ncbi:hypothetical protein RUM43_002483 [Polyplax serrata]|uniref:Uncharacterized protein n=1 Tax=Polyplax serrata TaxID=468196 RepID=A0AAN8PZK3_POLSC
MHSVSRMNFTDIKKKGREEQARGFPQGGRSDDTVTKKKTVRVAMRKVNCRCQGVRKSPPEERSRSEDGAGCDYPK